MEQRKGTPSGVPDTGRKKNQALAPEVAFGPQRLKPKVFENDSARLKPCPYNT